MKKKTLALALTAGIMSQSVMAADATQAQSTTQVDSLLQTIKKNTTVSVSTFMSGPSLATPTSSLRPDSDTGINNPNSPLTLDNSISAMYRLGESGFSLGPSFRFRWKPVQGQEANFIDPLIKLTRGRVINTGNFNLAADLRYIAPLSVASRAENTRSLGRIGSKQISSYDLGNFTFVGVTYAEFRMVRAQGATDFFVEVAPGVEYKLLPNLSLTTYYVADAAHRGGTDLTDFFAAGTELEPGFSWDITPTVNLNPYLGIQTGNRIHPDTTTINATLSMRVL